MTFAADNTVLVFDLDDTLYKEEDFLLSAYWHIAGKLEVDLKKNLYLQMKAWYIQGLSVFDVLKERFVIRQSIVELVEMYRQHSPSIQLDLETQYMLQKLSNESFEMGVITDGRSSSQRNKLRALEVDNLFDHVVISEEFGTEKPSELNFRHFMKLYPDMQYVYIGDNTAKDFVAPNRLGWTTVCLLDDGRNIHRQDFSLDKEYVPQIRIRLLVDLLRFII